MTATHRILPTALGYLAMIFTLGFALGTARTLWLAPRLGQTAAVAVEMPLILTASWLAARHWTTPRLASRRQALATGALAFVMLMGAELVLAMLAFGQTPEQWLAALTHLPGSLGLAGQVVFGLMPALAFRAVAQD